MFKMGYTITTAEIFSRWLNKTFAVVLKLQNGASLLAWLVTLSNGGTSSISKSDYNNLIITKFSVTKWERKLVLNLRAGTVRTLKKTGGAKGVTYKRKENYS